MTTENDNSREYTNEEPGAKRQTGRARFFRIFLTFALLLALALSVGLGVCLFYSNRELAQAVSGLREQTENLQQLQEEMASVAVLADAASEEDVEEEETLSISTDDWNLFLVNEQNYLPSDFSVELEKLPDTGGKEVDERIVEPLTEMLDDMEAEGLRPVVCSAYRTIEYQMELFENYIDKRLAEGWSYEDAFYKAKTRIALPGASEHHTGLAVDIVSKSHQSLDDAQADTKEAIWLAEHCAEYGFILRYPEDKEDITGIEYESWHFRYVGEEAAAYIMEHEITLEEYLALAG